MLEGKKGKRCPATQLSLEYLRAQGKLADVCERLIPIPMLPYPRKHDLFNIFDILYVDPQRNQTGYVQTTGWSSRGARKAKMLCRTAVEGSRYAPIDVMYALHNIVSVNVELHAWRKVEGQWEIAVYSPKLEYANGETNVILTPLTVLSMKEARALARTNEKEKAEQEERRVVRRL